MLVVWRNKRIPFIRPVETDQKDTQPLIQHKKKEKDLQVRIGDLVLL